MVKTRSKKKGRKCKTGGNTPQMVKYAKNVGEGIGHAVGETAQGTVGITRKVIQNVSGK